MCVAALLRRYRYKGGLRCVAVVGREDEEAGELRDGQSVEQLQISSRLIIVPRPAHRSEIFLTENSWHVLR